MSDTLIEDMAEIDRLSQRLHGLRHGHDSVLAGRRRLQAAGILDDALIRAYRILDGREEEE